MTPTSRVETARQIELLKGFGWVETARCTWTHEALEGEYTRREAVSLTYRVFEE